jgi:segregation and condensation protein B
MIMNNLKYILEAAIMSSSLSLSIEKMASLFDEQENVSSTDIKNALQELTEDYQERALELVETATGYRFQVRQHYSQWVTRLLEEKPAKYSRALLETLAIIAYRQPVTRAEIESIRGVAVSSTMVRTLLEREWVRVVGHRDVPGKPAIYATTKTFLDYFNLKTLEDLPSLQEVKSFEEIASSIEGQQIQLDFENDQKSSDEHAETEAEHAESEVEHAESEVGHAESEVEHAESEVEHAESEVEHAESEVEHAEFEVEYAETEVEYAETEVEYAETEVEHAESEVGHAESEVEHAESEVEYAETEVEHAAELKEGVSNSSPEFRAEDELDEIGKEESTEFSEEVV